ncbi:MAG: GNAT family N-acetyltransferase [Nitriliruptorales bacterium]|nr:GNAT family N-acetyltransferase [Nitriliruptorales bacterium]
MGNGLQLPDIFTGTDLVIRPPAAQDVDRVTEICQDPDIQRFTRVPVPYRRTDAESFVRMATEALARGAGAHLLVEVAGVVVGCVGSTIDRIDHVGTVGYWTAPEARRRRITTKAVRMLCRWLFEDVGLARIQLYAAGPNPGSNAIAARLGFQLEGVHRSALLLSPVEDLPADRADLNAWGLLPGELR